MTNLVVLRDTNLLDIPATLRRIADEIESGKYGPAECGVFVLDTARTIEVFYMGSGEAGPNAHLLLHAGAGKMIKTVMDAKG